MTDGTAQHRASIEPPLSNQGYDNLKKFVTVIFPAVITFYLGVAGYWDIPYTEPIVGTATGLSVLLGVVLKALSSQYSAIEEAKKAEAEAKVEYDGDIHFVKLGNDDATLFLNVGTQQEVENIGTKDVVTFKVHVG